MHVKAPSLMDSFNPVKECFVERSLCEFLLLSSSWGRFPSLPDTEWELGRTCPRIMGGSGESRQHWNAETLVLAELS